MGSNILIALDEKNIFEAKIISQIEKKCKNQNLENQKVFFGGQTRFRSLTQYQSLQRALGAQVAKDEKVTGSEPAGNLV